MENPGCYNESHRYPKKEGAAVKGIGRLLAGLLALIMVAAMVPLGAFAVEETLPEGDAVMEPAQIQEEIPEETAQEEAPQEEAQQEVLPAAEPAPVDRETTELVIQQESMLAGPAANLPSELFLTQEKSGTCTLCSAAMMLRSRMYLSGSNEWMDVTEAAIKSTAWSDGLKWNFTYTLNGSRITVGHVGRFNGISADSLKALLDKHPEGIVLYVRDLPHAVFVTDYEGDTFYCAETVKGYSGKRIPLASSWIGTKLGSQANILSCADDYWYITSYSIVVRPAEYTISYDAGEGSGAPDSQKKIQNEDAVLSTVIPTRENYRFLGWSRDAAAEEADYLPGSVYSENEAVTFYAVWQHTCEEAGTFGSWQTVKAAEAVAEGEEQRSCGVCGAVQTRKLIPVQLRSAVEPGTIVAGAAPGDVQISLSALFAIGGGSVADLELEYTITDETGTEVTLEQALATPGSYTITPKVKKS